MNSNPEFFILVWYHARIKNVCITITSSILHVMLQMHHLKVLTPDLKLSTACNKLTLECTVVTLRLVHQTRTVQKISHHTFLPALVSPSFLLFIQFVKIRCKSTDKVPAVRVLRVFRLSHTPKLSAQTKAHSSSVRGEEKKGRVGGCHGDASPAEANLCWSLFVRLTDWRLFTFKLNVCGSTELKLEQNQTCPSIK